MVAATETLKKHPPFAGNGHYATGFVDDADIAELEKHGLMVEVLPAPDATRIGWLAPGDAPPRPTLWSHLGLAADSPLGALAHRAPECYVT